MKLDGKVEKKEELKEREKEGIAGMRELTLNCLFMELIQSRLGFSLLFNVLLGENYNILLWLFKNVSSRWIEL